MNKINYLIALMILFLIMFTFFFIITLANGRLSKEYSEAWIENIPKKIKVGEEFNLELLIKNNKTKNNYSIIVLYGEETPDQNLLKEIPIINSKLLYNEKIIIPLKETKKIIIPIKINEKGMKKVLIKYKEESEKIFQELYFWLEVV